MIILADLNPFSAVIDIRLRTESDVYRRHDVYRLTSRDVYRRQIMTSKDDPRIGIQMKRKKNKRL